MIIIVYFVFRNDYKMILASIRLISIKNFLILLLLGTGYILLDVAAYYRMMKSQFNSFTFKMAFEITMLGTFANTSTSAAGTIPLQSYYLYRHSIPVGHAISTMIFECVFHKTAVLISAVVMILFHYHWLASEMPQLLKLIGLGIFLNAAFILFLILLCTSRQIQNFLLSLNHRLPDRGRFQTIKNSIEVHLIELMNESAEILHSKSCVSVILINILKLLWVYTIPYYCLYCCNILCLSFTQVQTLTAILFLIAGIIINIAGMGPTEFTFIHLFSPFIGHSQAAFCLILYRIAQYFWPFLLSMISSLKIKKEYEKNLDSNIQIGGL